MDRRRLLEIAFALMGGGGCLASPAGATGAPAGRQRSVAVLEFELIDDQNNPHTKAAQELRLRSATRQLRRELGEQGLYVVVDVAPSDDLQKRLRAQQETLFQCDDCSDQIGRLLGVELVMTPWVQKISELILNLNVQVYDVAARRIVLSHSVDMRGNADESWTRAVSFMVRELADARAGNPSQRQ